MLTPTLQQLVTQTPLLRDVLTEERVRAYQLKAGSLTLSYATELVTDEILSALFELAEEKKVMGWMQKMQSGEVINTFETFKGENRAALHTALRIPADTTSLAPNVQEVAKKNWQQLSFLEQFLQDTSHFTTVVQVGIGGSSLGPEAVYRALKPYALGRRRAYFISNVDPDAVMSVFEEIDLAHTLFVIVSKSGTTLETATNEAIIRQKLTAAHLIPSEHLIAVTEEKSLMDDPISYRAIFHLWDCIGGRFSVTSMVGAVVLSFIIGLNGFKQFLEGAHQMDQMALNPLPKENLPLLAALLGVWNHSYLNYPTVAVIPYSEALCRFPAHLQQLGMESNGKCITRQGTKVKALTSPIIWGEAGTNGQHSFFQQLHQGDLLTSLEFIGFSHSQYGQDVIVDHSFSQEKLLANLFAQVISLAQGKSSSNLNQHFEGNRPSHILMSKKCDPFTIGSLMAYYEHKIVFQGFLWGINSFDQEGVQLGKKVSSQMTEALVASREGKKIEDDLFRSYIDFISSQA
ncbi:MAG: glucose-6-phosphate isomerase [Candidatus Rhabdochlamydia sp.]